MTPEQVGLIQKSFEKVAPIQEVAADLFYNRLFELDPSLRTMFPEDLSEQKKKLMATIAFVVASLDRLDQIVPAVESLGRSHVAYGVQDKHYDTVGAALLWTLEQGLGEAWNDELKSAWAAAYGLLADTMQSAAADA